MKNPSRPESRLPLNPPEAESVLPLNSPEAESAPSPHPPEADAPLLQDAAKGEMPPARSALFHGDLVDSSRILYTPSAFARQSLLHIQEIGTLQATRPHVSRRENLASYLFFLVLSGSGTLRYEAHSYPLSAGDCVFIDCRSPYAHETDDPLWALSWVHFDGPAAADIYRKYLERGGLPAFHAGDPEPYRQLMHTLHTVAQSDSYVRDMEINARLASLLTQLMADSWHPEQVRPTSRKADLSAVKADLDRHFSEKITLDELAERHYINKFYLTRIFREQYGMSISAYLQSIRITHAKTLLRFTDRTAEEIGLACGIGPGYYFSRIFAKVEGMSPSDYRRSWRSK